MTRDHHKWFSRSLNRDMELLVFGHAGPPVIVFPTSMGAFFEYEDRGMITALADKLEHGQLRLFCVSSVDSESWYCKKIHPRHRVERHLHYEDYILNEVVPLIQPPDAPGRDRRHRLQLRRLSRDGAGAAPSLHLHLVRDDGRRVRHLAVPRRLLRRGLLLPEPAVVPAGPGGRRITSISSGATSGCWSPAITTSAARRTSSSRRCSAPRASRTACTSGTTRSTTGRTGGRWRRRIFPSGSAIRDSGSGIDAGSTDALRDRRFLIR